MKDNSKIVQRIKSCYVGEDCIQVMVPYREQCAIFNPNDIQYLDHKDNNFINTYTEDERRKQFPYHNITYHHHNRYINVANQLYEFNKPYLQFRFGAIFESYVVKDGDEALLATKQLYTKFKEKKCVTREQLRKILTEGTNDAIKKHYILFDDYSVKYDLYLMSEREMVDRVIRHGFIHQQFLLVDLDGVNITCTLVVVTFKGHCDEYEIELYNVPIQNYFYEEIKYLSSDIKETKEPKIKIRFNKGISKETIEEQKRLVLSKTSTKK